MTKRTDHTFQFTGLQISQAAKNEAEHRLARAAWWDAEYTKAVAKARELGVQVEEYDVTGGKRAQIVINTEVQTRITEAMNKRNDHQKQAERLLIAAQSYGTQKDRAYELDAEDIQFFRLVGKPTGEE